MVKSVVSVICAVLLLTVGVIYENYFVKKQFDEFGVVIDCLYEKTENKTANKEDLLAAVENWKDKKRVLHIFIPHNEIKEVELWLSEAVGLIAYKKYDEALSKLEVLKTLAKEIPKAFTISIDNIL